MTFDIYGDRAVEAMALIREFARVEYWDYFKGDPERALEAFCVMQDAAEAKSAANITGLIAQLESAQKTAIERGADLFVARSKVADLEAQVSTLKAAGGVPDELHAVGQLLLTQNNRITEAPLFVVEQKTPVISDSDYNDCRVEWRESENGDYELASPERAARLEAMYQAGRDTDGWRRLEITDVWTFVTACFTEQGCKDYLARNRHNLRETRIYAYGSFRNIEYRAVREWLMSLAAPQVAEQTKQQEPK